VGQVARDFDLTETAVREAERLVAAVARGVTMAGGAIRAAKARMTSLSQLIRASSSGRATG
jgi:hypothetical protein